MTMRRSGRKHAGISQEQEESYWDFRPGQRVMTTDGIPGVVTEVQDGPLPGTEQYIVTLDNGLGGGEYGASDLSALEGTTAGRDPQVEWAMETIAAAPSEAPANARVASEDYAELAEILIERPPLAHAEPLVMRASKTAEYGDGYDEDEDDPDWSGQEAYEEGGKSYCAYTACPGRLLGSHVAPDEFGDEYHDACWQQSSSPGKRASKTAATYYLDTPESNALYDAASTVLGQASQAMAAVEVPDSSIEDGTAKSIAEALAAESAKTDWAALHAYFVCDCGFAGNVDPVTDLATGQKVDVCPRCGQTSPYEEIDADGWGLDDPMRPANFIRAASQDKKMSAAEDHVFFATAGLWDKVLTKGTDILNSQMKPEYQVQPGTSHSFDWCRFRKNERCMFPKVLDTEGTKEAGYAVWTPEDRGLCPRNAWDAQKECPVSEPGPHSGDPNARVDATVSWSEGGQHGGTPTNVKLTSLISEAGFEITASWADVRTKARRIRSEGGVRIISAPRPGDNSLTVTAEIKGDNHVYETTLLREPGRHNVASWRCGCAWASYSWGRSPAYKRFEGRMCSHALALQYEAQSQGMFGRTITEQVDTPPWRVGNDPFEYVKPQKGHARAASKTAAPEIEIGYSPRSGAHVLVSYNGGKPQTACGKTLSGLSDSHYIEDTEEFDKGVCAKCQKASGKMAGFRPVYDDALFADAPITLIAMSGGLTVTAEKKAMDFGGRLKALVNGTVKAIKFVLVNDMHRWVITDDDQQVDASAVRYPTYHPTRGLTLTHTASAQDVDHLHEHDIKHVEMPNGERYPYDKPEFDPSTWAWGGVGFDDDFMFEGNGVEMEQGDPAGAASFGDTGSYSEAALHDEPEPALPTTEGDEDVERLHDEAIAVEAFADPAVAPEMAEVVTASLVTDPPKAGDPRLEWLMTGAEAPGSGDLDVAAGAKAYLAKQALKSFSPAEQKEIIEEGLDVLAANLEDLDIAGTHYEGLEAAFRQAEEDDE